MSRTALSKAISPQGKEGTLLTRIRSIYPSLYSAEKRVADLILKQPQKVVHLPIGEVARRSSVAKSTVVRFCRSIGHNGYSELKISLAQDLVPDVKYIHQDIRPRDDSATITQKVFHVNIHGLADSLKILDTKEMEKAIEALVNAKKVLFCGVGTSAPIAEEAYHRFLYLGIPCVFSGDPHLQIGLALSLTKQDVAVGVSHSGSTEDTLKPLRLAKENGATVICITNYINSPIAQLADIKLITSFREIIFRIGAMAARVAQLTIIEALYVNVAIKMKDKAVRNIEKLEKLLR
ncbi:MurR/RpiR family transcriptional regulator [Candidatus Aerophobetes bacterium]|nr:MurR/RpiR family transcriptional regulator [Candidatus Aerophobetes bacterium]